MSKSPVNYYQALLDPFPAPIGLFPQHLAQGTQSIVLKEKCLPLSGDDFTIKTTDGRPLFKVHGTVFSLSGRKQFTDVNGNLLFEIRKEVFTIMSRYNGSDAGGNVLFSVKSQLSLGTSKATCTFRDCSTGTEQRLLTNGNFVNTSAEIIDEFTGMVLARIDRQFFNARELLGGGQTYIVNIAPNVDMALIAALCICLDEKRNERT